MNKKFFVINESPNPLSQNEIEAIELESQITSKKLWEKRKSISKSVIKEDVPLKFVEGRVIVKADLEHKNQVTFSNGTTIRLERKFNEFNRRITQPVNAVVISAENIPENSEILISHNALHDSNRIFGYKNLSDTGDVKYYSLPLSDCFAWRNGSTEYQPLTNFEFALRVFKPYVGIIDGIEPTQIKNVLYITTGKLAGNVVHTLTASDYEIIFQGDDGRESHLIRCRHFGEEINEAEEIVAISEPLTKQVKSGELHIGLSASDCKSLK